MPWLGLNGVQKGIVPMPNDNRRPDERQRATQPLTASDAVITRIQDKGEEQMAPDSGASSSAAREIEEVAELWRGPRPGPR